MRRPLLPPVEAGFIIGFSAYSHEAELFGLAVRLCGPPLMRIPADKNSPCQAKTRVKVMSSDERSSGDVGTSPNEITQWAKANCTACSIDMEKLCRQ